MGFENEPICGIYATRFIASWTKMGGMLCCKKDRDDFHSWLLSLGLNESDTHIIMFLATNGKLELEMNARNFIKNIAEQ